MLMRFHFGVLFLISMAGFVVANDDSDTAKAIAKIELLGGKVTGDESSRGTPVVAVDFRDANKFGDGYVRLLTALASVKSLDVAYTRITDAGLKELANLKSLMSLNVTGARITDVGIEEFKHLPNLTSLSLGATQITDAGLKTIGEIKGLTYLFLGSTGITDRGVQELQGLENLTAIHLVGSRGVSRSTFELNKKSLDSLRHDSNTNFVSKSLCDPDNLSRGRLGYKFFVVRRAVAC